MLKYFTIIILLFLISCKTLHDTKKVTKTIKDTSAFNLNFWHQKDYGINKIPGISIDKWYKENKKKPKGNIIVAVIDTQIDSNHEDLQGQLWKNEKEIPNNKIDDDNDGYIDDINGWNYLGTKSGNYVVWTNFEYVRLIKKWGIYFENKTEDQIEEKNIVNYREYQRAIKKFTSYKNYYSFWLKSMKHDVAVYPLVKDTLKHFFPKEDYTYHQLDSLYKIYKTNDKSYQERRDNDDKDLGALISFMMGNIETNQRTLDDLKDVESQIDSIVNKNLGLDYNERIQIGDNPEKLEKNYGTNLMNLHIEGIRKLNGHNTEVSGIIAANRENTIGIKGFSNSIKIMPLVISASGDENDKDIALAIRYAVDNGAKIINMSSYKEFSVHKEWVFDALKYAEQHNVLFVHIAGNDSVNLDTNPVYPNDNDFTTDNELCNNFINVGATTNKLDEKFVASYSSYGKKNVDLFAPGSDIYTTFPENKYNTDSGTSLAAPMVSGAAALLWLYYPTLTVQEVKQIILESGTSYDIDVLVPGGEGKKQPFKELSKSGKVLNVYNAMKMAKEMSKLKK
jgi:cell wall-associated protease